MHVWAGHSFGYWCISELRLASVLWLLLFVQNFVGLVDFMQRLNLFIILFYVYGGEFLASLPQYTVHEY